MDDQVNDLNPDKRGDDASHPKDQHVAARIFPEDMGRYFTPFMARGMRQGMMMALKINAERMAL